MTHCKTSVPIKAFRIAVFAAALSLVAGCASLDALLKPKAENLIVAADFIPENYYQSRFIVMPTIADSAGFEFSPNDQKALINQLASYTAKVRPGLEFATYDEMVRSLGLQKAKDVAEEYYSTAQLSDQAIKRLTESFQFRYAVFPQVSSEHVKEDWSEYKDGDHYNVSAAVERIVYLQYSVIDLQRNQTVWSARIKDSLTETAYYERPVYESRDYGDAAGALAIIDVISGNNPTDRYKKDTRTREERYPFPQPAPVLSVVMDVNKGFVQNLEKLKSQ